MFPATDKTATQVYILPPEFNPLIEPYPLGLGYLVDRGVIRRFGPGPSRGDASSPLRTCGRAIPQGFARGEVGASIAEGPGRGMNLGPGQQGEPGAAGDSCPPRAPGRCGRGGADAMRRSPPTSMERPRWGWSPTR